MSAIQLPGEKAADRRDNRGETLKAVEKPDHLKVHRVKGCAYCGQSLKRRRAIGYEKRQVFAATLLTLLAVLTTTLLAEVTTFAAVCPPVLQCWIPH